MRRTHQPGFTLLEVLMVVVLIGILAGFAWPGFTAAERAEPLRESARRLRTLVTMCRAEAMNEARIYRVEIRIDGSVRARRQLDPLKAPHIFAPIEASWAKIPPLLPEVFVEAVQLMPDGPPPIHIIDDELEMPEMDEEPLPVEEFADMPQLLWIRFTPDGACNSLRWVLRDDWGRARLLTLDGRLGRVNIEPWPGIPPEDVLRPELLEEEDEEEYRVEDFE
jgi:type II secretion system protein H